MKSSWKVAKVVDLQAEKRWALNGGPFGSKLVSRNYVEKGVPVIRGTNLSGATKFSFDDFVYVTEEKADELRANNAHPGDLVFTQRGTIGQVGLIPLNSPYDRFVISQSQMKLTVDERKVYPLFLYYYFTTEKAVHDMHSLAFSAGVPHINLGILRDFKVSLPDLPTQRKIAGILSAYDDLIENNLRRIKILEEMAQSLYREWFVHFRFPGHESAKFLESSLGQIPEGWEVKTAGYLIGFHVGGGWGKEAQDNTHCESAYVIRGTDIPSARLCDRTSVPFRYHTESNLRSRRLEVGDIVFEVSGGSKGQPVGRALFVSKNLLDSFEGEDVMCASFCKLLRTDTKVIASELFYYHLKEIYDDGRIDQYQVQSTGITNFKFAPFLDQELVVVPPQNLQEKWVRSVVPLLQQIQTLGQKCQALRRTRDLLLPKLLSSHSLS